MQKFPLVGCGRVSAKHSESIKQIEKAKIVVCCEIIRNRVIESGRKYQISDHSPITKKCYPKLVDTFRC